MARFEKLVAWLHGEIKTPPLSAKARVQTGLALRWLQCASGKG